MEKEQLETEDLVSFSNLSLLLTGRKDVIRPNRIQKQYRHKVNELLTLIDYWKNKHCP